MVEFALFDKSGQCFDGVLDRYPRVNPGALNECKFIFAIRQCSNLSPPGKDLTFSFLAIC